jgi:hypothetical protein
MPNPRRFYYKRPDRFLPDAAEFDRIDRRSGRSKLPDSVESLRQAVAQYRSYGFFNLLGGFAMLAASVIAGSLRDAGGAKVTFLARACFTLMVLIRLLTIRGRINTKVATAV